MQPTEFIWHNGDFVKWDEAKVHVLTHALHYGSGVFEGIRAYNTEKGPAVFRLKEHMERLIYSGKALAMKIPYSPDELVEETLELLRKNKIEAAYIRPLVYYGYGVMGLNPKLAPVEAMISCWEWGAYLGHDMVDIKTSSYVRIHPQSTIADAKICGHYVNSIMAAIELFGTDYHEALLLDYEGNVAEGPGENLFIIKDGVVYTPNLGKILAGITRDTVIQFLSDEKIKLVEKVISIDDILSADEAFYTGTAAEIQPIRSLDKKQISNGKTGEVTKKVKTAYDDMVRGKLSKYEHFLSYV